MMRVSQGPGQDPSRGTWLQPGFLTWRALATALPPALLYAAETLYFKIWQNHQGNVVFSFLSALPAWMPDLLFILPVLGLFSWLLSISHKILRPAFLSIFAVLILFSVVFTAGHYAYFSTTGSALSWSVLDYWIRNLGETSLIVSSEATPARIAWLAIPVATLLVYALTLRLRAVRGFLEKKGSVSRRRSWALLGGLGAITLGLSLLWLTAGEKGFQARCVAFDRIWGLVSEKGLRVKLTSLTDSEKFDDLWEFARDPAAPHLNVVLFIFESLGWKSTDVYMPGLGTTPYLAELAKDSMVVKSFYTVVPHTTKALVPILAGYYPYLAHSPKEALPGILPRKSLAYILGDQGYATAFFQTANNFEQREQLISNLGFDVFRNLFSLPQEGFDDVNYFGKEENMMLRPSMDWVDGHRAQPFFLTYLTLSTHHQYGVPRSFQQIDFGVGHPLHNRYLNAVRHTDEFLKLVMAEFRARGLIDQTLFIIIGDHGEAFGEHGGHQHNQILWEEGLRTPALLTGPPTLPKGVTIEGTRSILDILPTVCDALGLHLTKGRFLGQSLLRPVPETRKLFFSGWSQGDCLALREGPIKVIYRFGAAPPEVYDNSTDPFDRYNLAGKGPYDADFIKARKEEMLHWQAVVNLQYLLWERQAIAGPASGPDF